MSSLNKIKSNERTTYNDYVTLTRSYLNSYTQFKKMLESLEKDKETYERRLRECDDIAAGIARYGLMAPSGQPNVFGHGPADLTAEKRERVRERLNAINKDVAALKEIIEKIEYAFASIPGTEMQMLKLHYIEKLHWGAIGEQMGVSRRWVTEKGNEALRKVALMLFGSIASMPEYNRFNFIF